MNIDDCWTRSSRDSSGNRQPDDTKFPDGIYGTAAYVHSKGLKLGIYEDAGTHTCKGYPGSLGHEYQDARSFASWNVDYLKYDNCYNQGVSAQTRYPTMRDALQATGRPMVYSICDIGLSSRWLWAARARACFRSRARSVRAAPVPRSRAWLDGRYFLTIRQALRVAQPDSAGAGTLIRATTPVGRGGG